MKRALAGCIAVIAIGSVLPLPAMEVGVEARPTQQAGVAAPVTEKDIQDAISWGLARDQRPPEPYVLAPYRGQPPESTLGAIGTLPVKQRAVILTPFVRIALAARAAADAQKPFTRADVTADMADSVVWVAAFAYDPHPGSARPTWDRLVDIRDVVVASGRGDPSSEEIIQEVPGAGAVAATWKEPSLGRIARVLHTKVTAKGMLAAFARDAFAPGRDLILLFAQPRSIPAEAASGRHYIGMRLPIRQADVSGWR